MVSLVAGPAVVEPATFTVTTKAATGPGSLRQAILDAEATPGADEIEFAEAVRGVLDPGVDHPDVGPLPDIAETLIIRGPGAHLLWIDFRSGRGFRFGAGVTARQSFTIEGLTLTGAPAILAEGSHLTSLKHCVVRDGKTVDGAVRILGGLLFVAHSTLHNNQAAGDGPGALYTLGNATIADSLVEDNSSLSGEGGAILVGTSGKLFIKRSIVRGNHSSLSGGAVTGIGDATVVISDSFVHGNIAEGGGGAVAVREGAFLLAENSTFERNWATGVGTWLGGAFQILGASTEAILRNLTLHENFAGEGAAIYNDAATLSLSVSTITGNGRTMGAPPTPALYAGGSVSVTATVIAWNHDGACDRVLGEAGSHSLVDDPSCGFTGPGNLPMTDPLLGPLAFNGGHTPTRYPMPGSPLIDAVGFGAVGCLNEDQRGFSRPFDGDGVGGAACDIGAVEHRIPALINVRLEEDSAPSTATPTNESRARFEFVPSSLERGSYDFAARWAAVVTAHLPAGGIDTTETTPFDASYMVRFDVLAPPGLEWRVPITAELSGELTARSSHIPDGSLPETFSFGGWTPFVGFDVSTVGSYGDLSVPAIPLISLPATHTIPFGLTRTMGFSGTGTGQLQSAFIRLEAPLAATVQRQLPTVGPAPPESAAIQLGLPGTIEDTTADDYPVGGGTRAEDTGDLFNVTFEVPAVFSDGFESGDLTVWSMAVQ